MKSLRALEITVGICVVYSSSIVRRLIRRLTDIVRASVTSSRQTSRSAILASRGDAFCLPTVRGFTQRRGRGVGSGTGAARRWRGATMVKLVVAGATACGRRLPRFNFSRSASGRLNERAGGSNERQDSQGRSVSRHLSDFSIFGKETEREGKRERENTDASALGLNMCPQYERRYMWSASLASFARPRPLPA